VNQELLLQKEYLVAENRILKAQLPSRLRLSNPERVTLAEIGKRLGRKALQVVACIAEPGTILAWYRNLIARKFDGSKHRQYPGRPRIEPKLEALVVRRARENSGWGYDRIVGAMANLGHRVSDQTVGNILRRHGLAPAPKRNQTTSWKDFVASHLSVLADADFFTVEVLTWRGLVTCYVPSSCIWKVGASVWRGSPDIRIKSGCLTKRARLLDGVSHESAEKAHLNPRSRVVYRRKRE
jgi:putative transposase